MAISIPSPIESTGGVDGKQVIPLPVGNDSLTNYVSYGPRMDNPYDTDDHSEQASKPQPLQIPR